MNPSPFIIFFSYYCYMENRTFNLEGCGKCFKKLFNDFSRSHLCISKRYLRTETQRWGRCIFALGSTIDITQGTFLKAITYVQGFCWRGFSTVIYIKLKHRTTLMKKEIYVVWFTDTNICDYVYRNGANCEIGFNRLIILFGRGWGWGRSGSIKRLHCQQICCIKRNTLHVSCVTRSPIKSDSRERNTKKLP